MVELHYSLEQLLAFQYVAEDLSFKKAADRLNLTPTALSHRIKKLEVFLELKLFERKTRTISLTPDGEYLFKHVRLGFDQIQKALKHMKQNRQRMLTITTIPPYASEWIIPYLPELQALYPDVMFRVHASYDTTNLNTGQYDIAIRYGLGGYQDVDVELLAKDEYVAVSHPLLKAEGVDWSTVPLIHFSWGDEYCPLKINWQKWYSQQNMQISSGQRQVFYSEENLAIQAVLAGQGVALLSKIAIANYLKHGTLKIVSDNVLQSMDYYFVTALNVDPIILNTKAWCREKLMNCLDSTASKKFQ